MLRLFFDLVVEFFLLIFNFFFLFEVSFYYVNKGMFVDLIPFCFFVRVVLG